ncbi:phytoene desaturase family protein [Propionibacteriaceae bacterium Y1685]
MSRVVVIGAGLAGLSAACHLRGAGHEVTVLERESIPGGRAGRLERDGFSFDTGPTVFTMPELVDDALQAVGSRLSDRVRLTRLDPAYRAHFADGSIIDVRAEHEDMRAEIARACGDDDAAAFDEFVDWLTALHDVEVPHFIDRNFNSSIDLVTRPAALLRLLRLGAFGRLGHSVGSRFTDDRLRRLFTFQAMYAGLAPDRALALYAVITYMDSVAGVWAPEGGIHAVPAAMAEAATAAGVDLVTDATVTAVLRRSDGAVAGVELAGGEKIAADAVVCTIDPPVAWQTVLTDTAPPRRPGRAQYSPSAVVWHLGVRGQVGPEVRHHNIHFGQQWGPAFDELLVGGTLMSDPSRLVCVPSLHDDTSAPDGHTSLYVLEPVPNLAVGRIDWEREAPVVRDLLGTFLAEQGYPTEVVTEEFVTPDDWLAQGMAAGTPFALAHTFAQTGPFRPRNRSRRVPGLVFAGSGTVPGVGVPIVLISGKLAAQRVTEYLR